MLERLNKVFITPLDPEDLHELATHVDDILDNLESVAYRLHAYELNPVPADMARRCNLAAQAAEKLCEAVDGLKQRNLKDRWERIAAACKEIARIEHGNRSSCRHSAVHPLGSASVDDALRSWRGNRCRRSAAS